MSRGICRQFLHCLETPLGLKVHAYHREWIIHDITDEKEHVETDSLLSFLYVQEQLFNIP